MAENIKVERPNQTIKVIISPITNDLKVKAATAFQEVVTKIKQKHLS
jgi:hypothetical protein